MVRTASSAELSLISEHEGQSDESGNYGGFHPHLDRLP
jgi:hypothetical protein